MPITFREYEQQIKLKDKELKECKQNFSKLREQYIALEKLEEKCKLQLTKYESTFVEYAEEFSRQEAEIKRLRGIIEKMQKKNVDIRLLKPFEELLPPDATWILKDVYDLLRFIESLESEGNT